MQYSNVNRNSKKHFFIKGCAFFCVLALISFAKPVRADYVNCIIEFVDTENKTFASLIIGTTDSADAIMYYNSVNSWCNRSAVDQLYDDYGNTSSSSTVTKIHVTPFIGDPTISWNDNGFTYEYLRTLTPEELIKYGCLFSSESGIDANILTGLGNAFINILPSSPNEVRIPTILNNMLGQGSLGGNLAVSLYNGIWQYMAIIVFVKFYKLLPGKST